MFVDRYVTVHSIRSNALVRVDHDKQKPLNKEILMNVMKKATFNSN